MMEIPEGVANDGQALAVVMEADELSEAMSLIVISSKTDLDFASAELRSIVTRKDAIEETFQRLKKPFADGIASLREFFNQPIKRLQEAEDAVKKQIAEFQQREVARIEELKREHATSRDDQIAEMKDRMAELEVASITASDLEQAEEYAQKAAEIRAQVDAIESLPPPVDVPAAPPKAEGVSVRANWQGEVVSVDLLFEAAIEDPTLRSLFKVDETAVRNMAKVIKSSRQIPGLRFFNKGSVSVRRQRSPEG